jgi:protein MpaA
MRNRIFAFLAAAALLLVAALAGSILPASAAPPGTGTSSWAQWGRSVEARPIKARRSGEPSSKFKVLVVGSVHGDEPQGIRVVDRINRRYRRGIGGVDLWTIRSLNPDGTRARTRGNVRGVDLNRNFPYRWNPRLDGGYESGPRPLSEPESRALKRMATWAKFDIAIFYHQPWNETLIPCDRTGPVAARYAKLSKLRGSRECDRYYPGSAINWLHHRFGTAAFVVEFGAGVLRRGQIRRHAWAAVRLAREFSAPRPDAG